MNREFKFRLHDKDGKVIGYEVHRKNEHNCFQIYQTSLRNGDPTDEMDVKKGYFIAAFYKCEFTGLKDKNGVDIYEGDIIKHNDYSNGAYITSTQPQRSSAVMVEDLFNGCKLPGLGFGFDKRQLEFIEVIGNIHENPELLNN